MTFLIFSSLLFSQNYFDDIESPSMQGTRFLVKTDGSVKAVAWSHDGSRYASAWGNSILVWDAKKNTIASIISNVINEKVNPFLTINEIQFNADDTHILCVTDDNKVILHDLSGKTDSMIIFGTGDKIPDACFLGSGVRFVVALDETSLYECVQDDLNNDFTIKKRLDIDSKVRFITTDDEGEYIIVATEDNKSILIDTKEWKILEETETYNQTHIKPKFSGSHKHFMYAKDKRHIYIQNTEDSRFDMDLQNEDFSYVAEFSHNEAFLVLAAENGRLHLFDLQVVKQERMFELLDDDDQVISLAWSSDDRFFVFGTKKGYLYRIDKFGRTYKIDSTEDEIYGENKDSSFVVGPKNKSSSSGGKNKSGSIPTISAVKSEIVKNYAAPNNFAALMLEYSTLDSDNYKGSFGLFAAYRNFTFFPIHFGGGVEARVGVPESDFDYKYYDANGNEIGMPYLYEAGFFLITGLSFSIAQKKRRRVCRCCSRS